MSHLSIEGNKRDCRYIVSRNGIESIQDESETIAVYIATGHEAKYISRKAKPKSFLWKEQEKGE